MKRRGLLIIAALAVLLTCVVLARGAASRRGYSAGARRLQHPFTGETSIRYRQAQPSHWRACLLQH